MARVKEAIDTVYAAKLYEKARFSIDSYAPAVIDYALSKGFGIVNDITGLADDAVCKVAARYDATVCIMHMKGTPADMQHNPEYGDVIPEVDAFFDERIAKARSFGIEKLLLDCGIGFGKTLEHNLALIKHQSTFLRHGYPLLVGASRKSLIDKITRAPIEARLPGTLALHQKALDEGASIIRAHDVAEHVQMMAVWRAFGAV
jgi:dihydropteroate synthase